MSATLESTLFTGPGNFSSVMDGWTAQHNSVWKYSHFIADCTFKIQTKYYSPTHTVVIFLCGPEANDSVGDRGGIDWGEASHSRQDHSILHAVVAGRQEKQARHIMAAIFFLGWKSISVVVKPSRSSERLLLNRVVTREGDEASPRYAEGVKNLGTCIQPSCGFHQLFDLQ